MAASKIEFENRSRTLWVLEHPDGDIIFGDAADRLVADRDPVHQRDPRVVLSAAKLERMPPHSRSALNKLVDNGDIQRRELA